MNNEGSLEDLALLEELSRTITETALCGLGQAACNPVVSTLKYFRKEYLAHVVDHHCPICNGRKRRLVIKPELCKNWILMDCKLTLKIVLLRRKMALLNFHQRN